MLCDKSKHNTEGNNDSIPSTSLGVDGGTAQEFCTYHQRYERQQLHDLIGPWNRAKRCLFMDHQSSFIKLGCRERLYVLISAENSKTKS
mmetsp:Transcript_41074/g.85519  ORF Transcript_41074/g.85519 Transcript_41074/m.85519 type:complete len:89 (-) Transcript_41074:158-424(-)